MPRPSNREELLAAASRLVHEGGPTSLTLDAVGEAAGVSKGGVLYHFPTKRALVGAVVDRVLDDFEAEVDRRAADATGPGAWAHAYVDATFDAVASGPDIAAALVGAGSAPGLLERCATRFDAWDRRLREDGLDGADAALVRYAADGWWTYAAVAEDRDPAPLRRRLHDLVEASLSEGGS